MRARVFDVGVLRDVDALTDVGAGFLALSDVEGSRR